MDITNICESLPDVGEPPKKVCAVCQAPADKSCGACHQIDYCSIEHQKSHWKAHKKDCPPIRIVTSQEYGRHYIATRDLPAGTLVLYETPLLAVPSVLANGGHALTCISCCVFLDTYDFYRCSKCQWVFCSETCAKNGLHTGIECIALANATTKQNKIKIIVSSTLNYLRALNLKQTEPEKWRKMMELPGADKYKSLEEGDENDKWFAEEILPLFGLIGAEFASDFLKVKGILEIHEFTKREIPSQYEPARGSTALLYLQTSLFPNACFPNTWKYIGTGPEFRLNAVTAVEVKKGAILSISYGDDTVITGAIKRQHTEEFGAFICHCPRCVDPTGTELGSMLSAVKCTEKGCKEGYLLPVDPLDMDIGAVWKCNGSEGGCKGASTWKEVDEVVSKLEALISDVPIEEFNGVKAFLEKLRSELHPNHWLLMRFQYVVMMKLGIQSIRKTQLSEARFELHISMLEDLLRMAEFTAPGSSWPRGHLLINLFRSLCFKLKSIISIKIQRDRYFPELTRKIFKVRDELLPIAKLYPDGYNEETLKEIKSLDSLRDQMEMI